MIIIRDVNTKPLSRFLGAALRDRLRIMPAVVVTGARQTGKSTLARDLVPGRRRFFSLDDLDVLDQLRRDPDALFQGPEPVTLDEVQREPEVLLAIKRAVDRRRRRMLAEGTGDRSVGSQCLTPFQWLTISPARLCDHAKSCACPGHTSGGIHSFFDPA